MELDVFDLNMIYIGDTTIRYNADRRRHDPLPRALRTYDIRQEDRERLERENQERIQRNAIKR